MKLKPMQEKLLLNVIAEAKNGAVPGKAESVEKTERSERSWFRK